MIKSWERLGDILADFENRLTTLENSQHFHNPEEPKEPEPVWSERQWGIVNQLRSEIRGWRSKYNETLNEIEKLTKKPKKHKVIHD